MDEWTSEDPIPAQGGHEEGTPSHWLDELPEEASFERRGEDGSYVPAPLREHPKLRTFRSVADLARSYVHQERLLGKKTLGLTPPAEDASAGDKAAFEREWRRALQVPDKPEGYAIRLPEDVEPDPRVLPWFRGVAHGLGLTPAQAQRLVDQYQDFCAGQLEEQAQGARQARAEAARRLEERFGRQAPAVAEAARRGFEALALRAGLDPEEAGDFAQTYGDQLTFLRVFAELGRMMDEHGLALGAPAAADDEPEDREAFYARLFPHG